jgi:PfaB family protein
MAFGFSLGEMTMRTSLGQWPDSGTFFAKSSSMSILSVVVGEMTAVRKAWGLPPSTGPDDRPIWESLIVKAPAAEVRAALKGEERVYLQSIHTPGEVMIGGEPKACFRVVERIGSAAIPLPLAWAAHAPLIAIEDSRLLLLADNPVEPVPDIDFYSTANYRPVPQTRADVSRAIVDMLESCVDFPRLVDRLYDDGARIFIETGLHNNCSNWIDTTLGDRPHLAVPLDIKGVASDLVWARSIAQLFSHRVRFDLGALVAEGWDEHAVRAAE